MSACPIDHKALQNMGCPVSANAAAFDPFTGPYQVDPAASLRWSRDEEPVFYSPELGYWVVTRYEDVKSVFRDNILFSPSIALEKITPVSEEATATLAKYDYAMARTMVNEDEPAHMPRRRALMDPFTPKELVHHEPMVRRLTREYVDRSSTPAAPTWSTRCCGRYRSPSPCTSSACRRRTWKSCAATRLRTPSTRGPPRGRGAGRGRRGRGQVLAVRRHGAREDAQGSVRPRLDAVRHPRPAGAAGRRHRLVPALDDDGGNRCGARDHGQRLGQRLPSAAREPQRVGGDLRRPEPDPERGRGVPAPFRFGGRVAPTGHRRHHHRRHRDPEGIEAADRHLVGQPRRATLRQCRRFRHPPRELQRPSDVRYGSHQCMGKNLARMEMQIFLEEFTKRIPHMELVPTRSSPTCRTRRSADRITFWCSGTRQRIRSAPTRRSSTRGSP